MTDKTSTLAIEVRTAQAVTELGKLKTKLAEVAVAAGAVSQAPVVKANTVPELRAATAGVTQYTSAMDLLEKSSTAGGAIQFRLTQRLGQVSASTKLAASAGLRDVKDFNTKLDATEFAAEAQRQKQMNARQVTYLARLKAADAERLAQQKMAAELRLAAERSAAQRMLGLRIEAIARLTALDRATYRVGSMAGRTLFADMLRGETRSSAASTMQQVALLTAATGAPRASNTAFADTLRQEAVDAKSVLSTRKQIGDRLSSNNAIMRDGHSAARGFLGTLRATWLTWGSFAPLLAGAAIGAAVTKTIQVGKDLEYRLKFVEALGNDPVTTEQLMPSVLGSMKTPTESAEAMQALAQAGLTSRQSLQALNTVMQLSTLGELNMEQASVSVTAALAAYNLEATEAVRVGDVFAKAASVSNTTVQKIAESMKQASTNAAQYKITLEETSAALAVMAQRNIIGSRAGTAFRNMTKEIYTPIARGAKALDQLGVSAYDAKNQMKPFQQVLLELRASLITLDEESKNAALEAIFGERGARAIKPILEDLDAYLAKVKEMEGAQGFLTIANTKLLDTVEGATNRLQSTVQQSFGKSFDNVKDSLRDLIDQLDRLAASEGFVSVIGGIASAFIRAADGIITARDTLKTLAIVYVLAKGSALLLTTAINAQILIKKAWTAATVAETIVEQANTVAVSRNTAAQLQNGAAQSAKAAGGIGRVTASMGGLVGIATKVTSVVGWASMAYLALSAVMGQGIEKMNQLEGAHRKEIKYLSDVADALERQVEIQKKLNDDRTSGIQLEDPRTAKEKLMGNYAEASERLQTERRMGEWRVDTNAQLIQQYGEQIRQQLEKNRTMAGTESLGRLQRDLMIENNQIRVRDLEITTQLAQLDKDRVRSVQALNNLLAQEQWAKTLSKAESAASMYQTMTREKENAESVLRTTKNPESLRQAKVVVDAANKYSKENPLEMKVAAYKVAAADGSDQAILDFQKEALDNYNLFKDAVRAGQKHMTFTTPKKGPVDKNSADSLLERISRGAAITSLKTAGDMLKANSQVTESLADAQRKLNEQYLSEDVIAGLRAREKAEDYFNKLLDARYAKILEIREAMKVEAKDPKKLAFAETQIAKTQADILTIHARKGQAGADAQVEGTRQYLADNTALSGVEKLFTQYRNEAMKTGDIVANSLKSAFTTAGDALGEFAATGKLNFRELTASILQDLSRIAMKMATNQMFSMVAGLVGKAMGGSYGSWDTGGGNVTTYTPAQTFAVSAKGNAFDAGNMMKFVQGGAFTNQITSGTNTAPMAMFGEAGPEAIMPLTRTADGNLGVRAVPIGAEKSGGGNVFYLSTTVNVAADGSSKSETKTDNSGLAQFGDQLNLMMKSVIVKETMQGGSINRAIRGA